MAERSNASSKKSQEAAQDVTTLQKRGRRRLVGAIALVLLAVIVLPMVFDPEPRPNAPLVSVRIPSEDASNFTPKATAKAAEPEPRPVEKKAEGKAPEPVPPAAQIAEVVAPAAEPVKAEDKPAAKPVPRPFEKTVTKAPEKATEKAPPAAAPGDQYMVQVGAFASPEKVKDVIDLLKEAKVPHYTESIATSGGSVTRLRMGPFGSKEAAEKARERVIALASARKLVLNPANPVVK